MSDATSLSAAGTALLARLQAASEEHERRLREDPAYRAEHEKREAVRHQEQERQRAAAERCRLDGIRTSRTAKGIPARFWPFLDAHRARQDQSLPPSIATAHGWVERFLAGKPGWSFLLLGGPVGVGKTAEACWFLDAPWIGVEPNRWTQEPTPVVRESGGRFVTAPELVRASAFDRDFWGALEDTPRLVIDDLGTERLDAPGQALANLTQLIAKRHAEQAPTLITLNLTRREFEVRYAAHDGGRLRDRFTEAGWWVEITGLSLRKRLDLGDNP